MNANKLSLISKKIMQDAGVTRHVVNQRPHYDGGRTINAPEVRNVDDLYILAHECGHAFHRHSRGGQKWLAEYQAERWAHDAFQRYGLRMSKARTLRAKENVRMEISAAWDFSPEQIAREAAEWSGGELPPL